MSKAGKRAHHLGTAWRWRYAEFTAFEQRFVVRLIVNEAKARAHGLLALRVGNDSAVLASYEFHPDINTGWHLHAYCEEIETAPLGTLVHGPWVKRLPRAKRPHRRKQFFNPQAAGDAEAWLWRETMRFFGIETKGTLV